MQSDYFKLAIKNLSNRKLRTTLTTLGIIIGVASILALVTISQGLQNAIEEQFEILGSDRIAVFAAGVGDPSLRTGLTKDDKKIIDRLAEVDYSAEYIINSATVEYKKEEQFILITSWPTELTEKLLTDYGLKVTEGRAFESQDKFSALLGYKASKDLFENEIPSGSQIEINGVKFRIIGILEEIGNPDDDNRIYIPTDAFRTTLKVPERTTFFDVKVKSGQDINAVSAKLEKEFEDEHGIDDVEVSTPQQFLDILNTILGVLTAVLAGIATISLVVGAVGILNSMYTNVLERTKEIGIMKSIGATNSTILTIFLIESGIIGLCGGIIGIIIGTTIAKLVQFAAEQAGFQLLSIKIDPLLIFASLLFAVLVGMISGALPANQASKLPPTEALRHD